MTHFVGCSQFLSLSAQKQLNVVSGEKPRISLSSWVRNENVDRAVPIKCLQRFAQQISQKHDANNKMYE